jgi:hypothetical protein
MKYNDQQLGRALTVYFLVFSYLSVNKGFRKGPGIQNKIGIGIEYDSGRAIRKQAEL